MKNSFLHLFFVCLLSFVLIFSFSACGGGGGGAVVVNRPPTKPINLLPENGALDQGVGPVLSWQASVDPEGDSLLYVILYSTDIINRGTVKSIQSTGTSLTLQDLTEGTWWWRVVTVDNGNNIERGERWSFTVGDAMPPITEAENFDSDLIVSDITEDGAILTWPEYHDQENPGATVWYDLRVDDPLTLSAERSLFGDTDILMNSRYLEVATTTTQASITLKSLKPDTRFEGTLVARSENNAQTSVGLFVFNTGNLKPSTPTYLSPANEATHVSRTATLTWNASTDADDDEVIYDIYIGKDRSSAQRITRSATVVTWLPSTPFENGQSYSWKVVAKDQRGGYREGDWWTFSVGNATPTDLKPVLPPDKATGVPANTRLEWECEDQDNDVLSYSLWFGIDKTKLTLLSTSLENPQYTFTSNLNQNRKYYWQVEANDKQSVSTRAVLKSAIWEFTTEATPNYPPRQPTLLTPTNNATGIVINPKLTWSCTDDNPADILTYSVYTGKAATGLTKIATTKLTNYSLSGLLYQTTYFWKIVADDGQKTDPRSTTESAVWSFTTIATPNLAPGIPYEPVPANNATGVALSATLSWKCEDINKDTLEFSIYMGTAEATLTKIATTTSFSYKPTTMSTGTTYFWKIIADDKKSTSERLTTEGPIWKFGTVTTP